MIFWDLLPDTVKLGIILFTLLQLVCAGFIGIWYSRRLSELDREIREEERKRLMEECTAYARKSQGPIKNRG